MRRFGETTLLFICTAVLSCGPVQQISVEPPGTGGGPPIPPGGTCLEPDDVNSPWLVGLDATSRGTIARNAERGLVLVKQGECGTFQMLADCFFKEQPYKDIPAQTIRLDAVEVSNRRQLQKKVPLAVAKYAARMDDNESWSLDYVDAGEKSYSESIEEINWNKLRPSCRAATHYVYKITRGAFQLSMINESERVHEGNIGPADFKKRSERRKVESSKDGDYAGCAASSDANIAACKGLIRMWVEPIPGGMRYKEDDGQGPPVPVPNNDSSSTSPSSPKPTLEQAWKDLRSDVSKPKTTKEQELTFYRDFLDIFPSKHRHTAKAKKAITRLEKELDDELEARLIREEQERQQNAVKARKAEIKAAYDSAYSISNAASKLAAMERFVERYPGNDNRHLGAANRQIRNLKSQVTRQEQEAAEEDRKARLAAKRAAAEAKKKEERSAGKAGVNWIYSKPAGVYFTKSEVTLGQFEKCVNAGGCKEKNRETKLYYQYCNWGYSDRDNHPMNCVDWYGAKDFCEWAGGRLPTGDEWYAEASKGEDRDWPWGDSPDVSCSYAIMDNGTDGCGKKRTWPVCSKTKGNSVSGLCDMSGNVWEWTSDRYRSGNGARMMRGGSWNNDNPVALRSSGRFGSNPTFGFSSDGFRCVRSPPDSLLNSGSLFSEDRGQGRSPGEIFWRR